MAEFFRPYEGSSPYYFISYSHRDSQQVLDMITRLRREGYRIWYDEGIPAGSDWPRNIREHMEGCGAVLFFQSENALSSANCYNEIHAAHARKKPVYVIPLDDALPESRWAEATEGAAYIRCQADAEQLSRAIPLQCNGQAFLGSEADYAEHRQGSARRSLWDIVLAALVLLVVGFGAFAFWESRSSAITEPRTHVIRKQTVQQAPSIDLGQWESALSGKIVFPDDQQENAVRDQLGNYDELIGAAALTELNRLSFCGSKAMKNGTENVRYENGQWTLSGITLPPGKVQDLSLIGQMPYLEQLDLIYQPVKDLSGLSSLIVLRQLNLAGCEAVDLSTLPPLQSLEVLALEHSGVKDLRCLAVQPALAIVTVSSDMFPMVLDSTAKYDVVLVP